MYFYLGIPLKKTSKATLLHKLEGKVEPLESLQGRHALIVDGMAYVQQSKVCNKTFGQFAMDLLQRILAVGARAYCVDVVFDEYRDVSIKNVEQNRRSRGNHLVFKQTVSSATIKQWGSFLSCNENKNSLIAFVVPEWKKEEYRLKIGSKDVFVIDGEKVFKINQNEVSQIEELESNYEEADTRMVLHANHASSTYEKIMISSPDTDVFVICLSVHHLIDANIYFLTGVKSTRRIIDITAVAENIYKSMNVCDASKQSFMESLVGFHSFTGCDTISAFTGRGKTKPLKLMVKDERYVEAFALLGKEIQLTESLVATLEKFVCHMYGWKGHESLNEIRYCMYCQSGGKISCEQLPPCNDVLELHMMRANYQAYIWRQSLGPQQTEVDHGWLRDEESNCLDIKWMRCNPAPDEVRFIVFQRGTILMTMCNHSFDLYCMYKSILLLRISCIRCNL